MKTVAYATVLALILSAVSGCGRAAKEAVGTVMGAKGTYVQLSPQVSKDRRLLADYKRFELGQITDSFGGKVPPQVTEYLPAKFAQQLREAKLPNETGGKTLLIRGVIYHYEDEGLVGAVLGPLEEVVARLELVDKSSGKVLATGNCIGRTTETVNKGTEKKAEGLAKAIVSWIKDNYPKIEDEE